MFSGSADEAERHTQTFPMDIQTIEEEDETQVETMSSSTAHAIHRSKCTQTTTFKLTKRSVKTQTVIDTTSSFFCEMKQPLPASELPPENLLILRANKQSARIGKISGGSRIEQYQRRSSITGPPILFKRGKNYRKIRH